jgi:hypothetical protein
VAPRSSEEVAIACITDTTPQRRLSARLAAGLAICAILALGTFAAPADAREYRHHYYNGGYYRAPPIVYGSRYRSSYYGSPYYYAPPVVYGPGIGISLPFVGIRIR